MSDVSQFLFPDEELPLSSLVPHEQVDLTNSEINEKYVKGDVRIVTEQARYPLTAIVGMIESGDYQLDPEFQRRHRWYAEKQSRLIESFIMNVPIPPIFLYEDRFSHYQVMDGLQRMSAIYDFYTDKLRLEGLVEWSELNGRLYSELPEFVKRGVDRRYLSSIILLQETAKNELEADRLKQLVFERINSGGIRLSPQESRNAIYNGPLNQLCIRLSRNSYLCRMWQIPEPTPDEVIGGSPSEKTLHNESYRTMEDVELTLRFFAYRQRLRHHRGGPLSTYLDNYLKLGNRYSASVLEKLSRLFEDTCKLVYQTLGSSAFWLYRSRKTKSGSLDSWAWLKRPTVTVYDPMMYAFSQHLHNSEEIVSRKALFQSKIVDFYSDHYDQFEGRYTNLSNIAARNRLYLEFISDILSY